MLVYICCSGGATSSLFCSKIKKSSTEDNVLVDDIMTIISNFDEYGDKFKFILAYGPAGFIKESSIKDYNLDKIIDLILVCPQVRYLVPSIKRITESYNIACDALDMKTFGTMNGEKALKDIIEYASK
ncbi:PTS beta-glucoside transporter subunit IIB [Clostridium tertium]|uniref:Lichenan-specific phosphotransferase enzyme IIB component n=1 Tax=Clostridium tertium TaxID=1559 RepID=A0A6N2YPU2_9CLOT